MKKNYFLFFLFFVSLLSFGQVQIGSDINGKVVGERSGYSVSLSDDGKIVAIGSPYNLESGKGVVRVYKNTSGTWTQIGADIVAKSSDISFGFSVSLSKDGNILAIGATKTPARGSETGIVRVYENKSGSWTQMSSDIVGGNSGNNFGWSVSLSDNGDKIAIGAPFANSQYPAQGYVDIYEYKYKTQTAVNKTWIKMGKSINGVNQSDYTGYSVSLSADGSTVAVGYPGDQGSFGTNNAVKVYKYINSEWTLVNSQINGQPTESFGTSVSLSADGNTVAIGATNDSSSNGKVSVYQNVSNVWTKIGSDIIGEAAGDQFGYSVSLSNDGTTVAIGAYGNDGNGTDSGHVRIYQNKGGVWTKIGVDIKGKVSNDFSGHVALSGDANTIAVGAPGNAAGHVRVYDLVTLGSDDFVLERFAVYPNPAIDFVTIQLQDNLTLERVNIYNSLGQLVKTDSQHTINISALAKGTYYFEVYTNQGKATRAVVK